jgi:hypothetical protein
MLWVGAVGGLLLSLSFCSVCESVSVFVSMLILHDVSVFLSVSE